MRPSDLEDSTSLLQRAHILDACQHGPIGRTTISERAECSRSTAYRATSELTDRGLLERTDNGYQLTGAGAAMLDHVRQFLAKQKGTTQILPLFEYVDEPEFIRHAHLFGNAELVTQDASNPYHIENRMKELIEDTQEQMLGMTTGLGSPALAEAMIDRIRAGVRVNWILPTDMYAQFNADYGDLSTHAKTDGQTAVSVRDDILIDMALYDDTLAIIGFDHDRGILGAVAITDNPTARRWARDTFEKHRQETEQVE